MRPIDADLVREQIKKSDLSNREKIALLLCLSSVPTIEPPPDDTLTQEQLREMDGEPVWCKVGPGQWGIVNKFVDEVVFYNGGTIPIAHLQGRAYRRKPEEGI